MKVILSKDVSNLGRRGDVKEVVDGFARNFLLPQNLAILATEKALGELEKSKKTEQRREEKRLKMLKKLAKEINDKIFEIKMKIGEKGRLYGSVTSKIISDKLKSVGYQVNSAEIILEQPIKETGEYSLKIKFNENITANIKVVIMPG